MRMQLDISVVCTPCAQDNPSLLKFCLAAGLVVLLYDHILTFNEEVRLVWRAPHSFPKYAFLFNRYLVLSCLLPVAHGERHAFSWRYTGN